MNCGNCKNLMSRSLDDRLDDEERREMEVHLDDCSACNALLETMSQMQRALGALDAAEPPADLAARSVEAALSGRTSGEAAGSFLERLFPIAWPTAAVAVAVAVLLLLLQGPGEKPGVVSTGDEDPVGSLTSLPQELTDPTIVLLGETE